jgi:hypothetical protein
MQITQYGKGPFEMDEKLYELLMKLPKANLINLMYGALDEMQSYNGRSRFACIMLAMGHAVDEELTETGRSKYKIKSLAELKRSTETMGL